MPTRAISIRIWWTRKVRRGLSAGRVQSVAIRMVVDRENEIRAFQPEEYWYLDAHLDRAGKKGGFVARYYGTADKKKELHSEKEVEDVIAAVAGEVFSCMQTLREKAFLPEYRRRSILLGQEISFEQNGIVQPATAVDIDEEGGLLVRLPDGRERLLNSGEVTVRPCAVQ